MSNISLAQATGTRLDSATKHICIGRADTNEISKHISGKHPGQNVADVLKRQKHDYAIHKGDIVANSSALGWKDVKHASGAYTPVLNQVLDHDKDVESPLTQQNIKVEENPQVEGYVGKRGLTFAGIALGRGEAHGNTGDDAMAIMMGGTMTIRNGPEQIHAGQQVYWDCKGSQRPNAGRERNCTIGINPQPGQFVIYPFYEKYWRDPDNNKYKEIIGRALTSARPWEMIDIIIARHNSHAQYLSG